MPSSVVHYEKITGGGSGSLPGEGSGVSFPLVPTFGKALKRVMTRGVSIRGRNSGLTYSVIEPIILNWHIWYATGTAGDGEDVFEHSVLLPYQCTGFFADAVDVYNVFWGGGDAEIGFDQEILRGHPYDDEGNQLVVQLTCSGPGTENWVGNISYDVELMGIWAYNA